MPNDGYPKLSKFERIEDVPEDQLPPLIPMPESSLRADSDSRMPNANVPYQQQAANAPANLNGFDQSTTLVSILNSLTRIEQMLSQMVN